MNISPRRPILQRPLDDYSNTYIGLHSMDPSIGTGHYKYGEYQYVCSAVQILAKDCFSDVQMYGNLDFVFFHYLTFSFLALHHHTRTV